MGPWPKSGLSSLFGAAAPLGVGLALLPWDASLRLASVPRVGPWGFGLVQVRWGIRLRALTWLGPLAQVGAQLASVLDTTSRLTHSARRLRILALVAFGGAHLGPHAVDPSL